MSKRILILSASPRKGGNSDVLCDAFRRGAEESGHKVEKLRLSERNIHYCTGCGVCNIPTAVSRRMTWHRFWSGWCRRM